MNIYVKVHVPDDLTRAGTYRKFAEAILKKAFGKDSLADRYNVMSIHGDSGEILQEIEIDLHGVLKVVGGISFYDSKGKLYQLIIADYHGACLMLYELEDDKAYFHGALSGIELDRFNFAHPGHSFSYCRRVYRKMTGKEVFSLIKKDKYTYSTCEKIESARKAGKPPKLGR